MILERRALVRSCPSRSHLDFELALTRNRHSKGMSNPLGDCSYVVLGLEAKCILKLLSRTGPDDLMLEALFTPALR